MLQRGEHILALELIVDGTSPYLVIGQQLPHNYPKTLNQ